MTRIVQMEKGQALRENLGALARKIGKPGQNNAMRKDWPSHHGPSALQSARFMEHTTSK